ncbi:MAG: HAD-IA family hydrolase [Bacteroidia bacterium]|nr:HAD-IA family hydrolase [Bacteroidia bacterium]MDW8133430.1 HAD-IA family hydrolase [Bacteroidia bacterium]
MIKNLLLDLGGVLYGVEYARTALALGLSVEHLPQLLGDPMLAAYEKGKVSTDSFLAYWHTRFPHYSREELINAWNAMLLGPLPASQGVLEELSKRFSLAVLSNTNELHLNRVLPEIGGWKPYFVGMFFSPSLHYRKPEPAAYKSVLQALGWKPEETLFIDDSSSNIEGAATVGLATLLLSPSNSPEKLLSLLGQ